MTYSYHLPVKPRSPRGSQNEMGTTAVFPHLCLSTTAPLRQRRELGTTTRCQTPPRAF
jgi:hypothetical protein